MPGNATYRSSNTAVLAVCAIDASVVVPSSAFDEQLAETYRRVGLRPGLLERLAGIRERRWWPDDVTYADGAATAGAKALAEAGVDTARVGLMVNTSVSRAYLEPSSSTARTRAPSRRRRSSGCAVRGRRHATSSPTSPR